MSASTKVSTQIDHCATTLQAAQRALLSLCDVCVCACVHCFALEQEQCRDCCRWTTRRSDRSHRCSDCAREYRSQREQLLSLPPLPPSPPPAPSPPPSLFGRPSGCIDQLTEVERAAIITLHKIGRRTIGGGCCGATTPCSLSAARLAST